MSRAQPIRVALFYSLLLFTSFIWFVVIFIPAMILPFRLRYRCVVIPWCHWVMTLLRLTVKIRYRVTGLENMPAQACVILSKHQSTWETIFLSCLFQPLSQVLKRELLHIPFFGWMLAMMKPIAIDRGNPKRSLRQLAKQGDDYLKQNIWVLIFPEGTRTPPGQMNKFSRGGAALAVHANLPVLPIAHNAGEYWPKQGWNKYAGTIQVVIGPAMYAEGGGSQAIDQLNQRAEAWITQTMMEISPLHRASDYPESSSKLS